VAAAVTKSVATMSGAEISRAHGRESCGSHPSAARAREDAGIKACPTPRRRLTPCTDASAFGGAFI